VTTAWIPEGGTRVSSQRKVDASIRSAHPATEQTARTASEPPRVELGVCGRAYGTPCIHEHACLRCPLLRPDPQQQRRLIEIQDNLKARLVEAKNRGWLGEVEGLNISLAGAEQKLATMKSQVHLITGEQ
jgi:hypothetical protein